MLYLRPRPPVEGKGTGETVEHGHIGVNDGADALVAGESYRGPPVAFAWQALEVRKAGKRGQIGHGVLCAGVQPGLADEGLPVDAGPAVHQCVAYEFVAVLHGREAAKAQQGLIGGCGIRIRPGRGWREVLACGGTKAHGLPNCPSMPIGPGLVGVSLRGVDIARYSAGQGVIFIAPAVKRQGAVGRGLVLGREVYAVREGIAQRVDCAERFSRRGASLVVKAKFFVPAWLRLKSRMILAPSNAELLLL